MAAEFIKQINDAIGSHALWKDRLQQALATGSCDMTATGAARSHACAFGRWLNSDALDGEDRAHLSFRAVAEMHREFHTIAGTMLTLVQRGALEEARSLFEGDFAKQSGKLTRALRQWKKELRQGIH